MTEPNFAGAFSPEESTSIDLPGRHLAAARAGRGLSMEDVAQALKFSERQIAALEQDDYSTLQGGTFVRGFVRSYARYLKLDPIPLLAMLDAGVGLSQAEIVAPQNMGDATPASGLPRKIIWGLASLVIGLSVVGYFWIFGLPGESTPEAKSAAPQEAVTPPVAVSAVPQQSAPVSSETPVSPTIEGTTSLTPPAAPEPDKMAPVPETAAPPVAVPALATAPRTADHQLMIDFSAKSWIEIKSGSDILLTGEFPAGTQRVVSARGPLQVWIGNAPGVRLSRDGQAVDLAPSSRAGIARLTLE